MTAAAKLEWAAYVLDQHEHLRQSWLAVVREGTSWAVGGEGRLLAPIEAIAVALALDERARRRLNCLEQAEWAAKMLNREPSPAAKLLMMQHGILGQGWEPTPAGGALTYLRVGGARESLPLPTALALAEWLFRDEMLRIEGGAS